MEKRRKLNKNIIFIMLSIIFITFFIVLYGVRFVHYYKLEHPKSNGHVVTYFSSILTASLKNSTTDTGLFYDTEKEEYYYKGKTNNNYIWYSGFLWRIVSISKDNKIKLITDKSSTILNYGEEEYDNSYLNHWLNQKEFVDNSGVFDNFLYEKDKYLTLTTICDDKFDDISSLSCDKTSTNNLVSLISLYEYNRAGGINSFMNTEEYLWTINTNTENNPWYIYTTGGVNVESEKSTKFYGVKPVVTLKENLVISSGSGTYEKPYIIADDNDSTLSNRMVGEYISFENYTWRIIEKTDTAVKIAMEGFIKDGENELTKAFSTSKNTADIKDTTSIVYYLNNTFYKSFENKEYVQKGSYNITAVDVRNFDYKIFNTKNIEANVGLVSLTDLFSTNYKDYYLFNSSVDASDLVYLVNETGVLFGEKYSTKKHVRPVLYLDNTLLALGGKGTYNEPYILGR